MTEKQLRNRQHYQANKNRILTNAKQRYESKKQNSTQDTSQLNFNTPLLPAPTLIEKRSTMSILEALNSILNFCRQNLLLVWLGCLVFTLTTILLWDSITFFAVAEAGIVAGLIRAGAMEISTVTLSALSCNSWSSWMKQKTLQVLLMALSLWLACAPIFNQGLSEYTSAKTVTQRISNLEGEGRRLRAMQDEYFKHDWISAGRKLDSQIALLESERRVLTSQKVREPLVILNTMITSLAYRILILLANVYFSARLAEIFRLRRKNRSEKSRVLKNSAEKLKTETEKNSSAQPETKLRLASAENFSQFSLWDMAELKNGLMN